MNGRPGRKPPKPPGRLRTAYIEKTHRRIQNKIQRRGRYSENQIRKMLRALQQQYTLLYRRLELLNENIGVVKRPAQVVRIRKLLEKRRKIEYELSVLNIRFVMLEYYLETLLTKRISPEAKRDALRNVVAMRREMINLENMEK